MLMIKKPKKILIVRLSAIGDVVHVLPALRSLRSNFPDSKITWLVEDKASDILTGHPDIDEVITFPRRKWQRNILKINKITNTVFEIFSFYKKLRKDCYDIVIDFQGNLKSGVMTIMTGSENRIGFGKGYCKEFNYLFTKYRIRPPRKRMHKIDKNLALLGGLGIETNFHRPELPVSKADEKYISKFLRTNINDSFPIIVVQPCASRFGSYKQWPVSNYALLADKILESYEANVILSWGPGEIDVVNEIVMNMKHKALVACETKSIKQLIELIRRADLFIGGDTGPLHIASILGIPTVGIYGPKDPVIYGPYNGKAVVVRKELWCSPCKKRTCSDPECMTSILPEDVFHAVNKLLGR
ncbi:MAG TPA: glycosyltransferase family 9 protein [Candidatus Scalindua sp.]|nr:glycosyltransferase family 9 protein [Candidatus Scalindua sp.]